MKEANYTILSNNGFIAIQSGPDIPYHELSPLQPLQWSNSDKCERTHCPLYWNSGTLKLGCVREHCRVFAMRGAPEQELLFMPEKVHETATIKIKKFRDARGNPTCAANWETGELCQFLGTKRMGIQEVCAFHVNDVLLHRRESSTGEAGEGSLVPDKSCPLWVEK